MGNQSKCKTSSASDEAPRHASCLDCTIRLVAMNSMIAQQLAMSVQWLFSIAPNQHDTSRQPYRSSLIHIQQRPAISSNGIPQLSSNRGQICRHHTSSRSLRFVVRDRLKAVCIPADLLGITPQASSPMRNPKGSKGPPQAISNSSKTLLMRVL